MEPKFFAHMLLRDGVFAVRDLASARVGRSGVGRPPERVTLLRQSILQKVLTGELA
jgi:hypothetical protein